MASSRVKTTDVMTEGNGRCGYWLRDISDERGVGEYIWELNGSVSTSVFGVLQGVRPAMWYSLDN